MNEFNPGRFACLPFWVKKGQSAADWVFELDAVDVQTCTVNAYSSSDNGQYFGEPMGFVIKPMYVNDSYSIGDASVAGNHDFIDGLFSPVR